ncbi:MAG TPA: hypothetical protein VJM08_17195, partial [Anaerolineales bacterium]|nr:hypothetical protein [Anaerolineales bacterium]
AYLQYGLTIVNQDGTGRTITERPGDFPVCNLDAGVDIQENLSNRLVIFPRTVYLVQPGPTWTLIYREWPSYHTDFTGDERSGLLANIYQPASDVVPELRIYEMPSGRIRNQLPLMKCSTQCNINNINWWEIKWSPNGHYLAFPAVLEGSSSDLYVYDAEDGSVRRLTSGPDDVGTIWWSPDGSQIIMGEILENNYPYISSLWVVSVSGSEIRLLYSLGENSYPQGLLGWLDDRRFIIYNGTNLSNALELPANNLRVVDKDTGKVTTLFNGSFMAAAFDISHETIMFFTNDEESTAGFSGPGIYIVSIANPVPNFVQEARSVPWWDNEIGLFVTDDPCENDPTGRKAFDYRGEWQCVHPEIPPESLASPDGAWQVVLQDGFQLKTNDGQPIQVSEATPTQIIWRSDSKGFFFIANQVLYYASLPELDIKVVDEYPGGDTIIYQWVSI